MRISLTTTLILITGSALPSFAAPVISQEGGTLIARDRVDRWSEFSPAPGDLFACTVGQVCLPNHIPSLTTHVLLGSAEV